MPTTILYRVHGAAIGPRARSIQQDGETVQAVVPALVVELVPQEQGAHGSVTLVNFGGRETLERQLADWPPGGAVAARFERVEG